MMMIWMISGAKRQNKARHGLPFCWLLAATAQAAMAEVNEPSKAAQAASESKKGAFWAVLKGFSSGFEPRR